jgi:hypothetical protein
MNDDVLRGNKSRAASVQTLSKRLKAASSAAVT